MKNLFVLLLIFVSIKFVSAQECATYFPLVQDTGFEMLNYDAKGKPSGTSKFTVLDVAVSGGMKVAKVRAEFIDKKGKEAFSGEYEVKCDGEKIYIDMKAFINHQQMEAYKDMEMTVTSEDMILPARMKVGDEIKDAKVETTLRNNGVNFGTFGVNSENRRVVAKEKISVPAGEFSCYKIEGDMRSESKAMGIPMKFEFRNVEWYAEGVGMVRSESYSKKGKLTGYTVLKSRF